MLHTNSHYKHRTEVFINNLMRSKNQDVFSKSRSAALKSPKNSKSKRKRGRESSYSDKLASTMYSAKMLIRNLRALFSRFIENEEEPISVESCCEIIDILIKWNEEENILDESKEDIIKSMRPRNNNHENSIYEKDEKSVNEASEAEIGTLKTSDSETSSSTEGSLNETGSSSTEENISDRSEENKFFVGNITSVSNSCEEDTPSQSSSKPSSVDSFIIQKDKNLRDLRALRCKAGTEEGKNILNSDERILLSDEFWWYSKAAVKDRESHLALCRKLVAVFPEKFNPLDFFTPQLKMRT